MRGVTKSQPHLTRAADGDDALQPGAGARAGHRDHGVDVAEPDGRLRHRRVLAQPRAVGRPAAVHARGGRDVVEGGRRRVDRRARASRRARRTPIRSSCARRRTTRAIRKLDDAPTSNDPANWATTWRALPAQARRRQRPVARAGSGLRRRSRRSVRAPGCSPAASRSSRAARAGSARRSRATFASARRGRRGRRPRGRRGARTAGSPLVADVTGRGRRSPQPWRHGRAGSAGSTSSSRMQASCRRGARPAGSTSTELDEVLAVNVRGVAATLKHGVAALAERGGAIVGWRR